MKTTLFAILILSIASCTPRQTYVCTTTTKTDRGITDRPSLDTFIEYNKTRREIRYIEQQHTYSYNVGVVVISKSTVCI